MLKPKWLKKKNFEYHIINNNLTDAIDEFKQLLNDIRDKSGVVQ